MEITKTTKEALQILARCYGREVEVSLRLRDSTQKKTIDAFLLDALSNGCYKSFRITSLRSLDEMSEEEMNEYERISNTQTSMAFEVHYLESIGIDTMDLKNLTIEIKD